ncbi:hypothetical protein GCM10010342_28760 [Streptomyces anulatus]|nr:hypothetical protein GCM10010342_28760 [Streptomyces anulatus]
MAVRARDRAPGVPYRPELVQGLVAGERDVGAAGLQDGEYRGQGVRSARQQYGDGDLTAAALGHQHPGRRGAGGQEFAPGHPDRALNGGRPLRGEVP